MDFDRRGATLGGVGALVWLLGTVVVTPVADGTPLVGLGQLLIDVSPGAVATFAIDTFGKSAQPAVVVSVGVGIVAAGAALGGFHDRLPAAVRELPVVGAVIVVLTAAAYAVTGVPSVVRLAGAVLLSTAPVVFYGWTLTREPGDGSAGGERRSFLKQTVAGAVGVLAVGAVSRASTVVAPPEDDQPRAIDRDGAGTNDSDDPGGKREQGTTIPSTPTVTPTVELTRQKVRNEITISTADSEKPFGFEFAGMPEQITPTEDHYVIDKAVDNPEIDGESWSLSIRGEVAEPYELTLQELIDHEEATERAITMVCISNDVGGRLISTGRWLGVPLKSLVEEAGPTDSVTDVVTRAADGYHEGIPWSYIREHPEAMIAVGLNGTELPTRNGYPARLQIPGRYGMRSTKWLSEIELSTRDHESYWESRGWDEEAVIQTLSYLRAVQQRGDRLAVGGVAYAGLRGIERVEVSVDGGDTWSEADLEAPPGELAWRRWRLVTERPEGEFEAVVRATDGTGTTQTKEKMKKHQGGATGWHRRKFDP